MAGELRTAVAAMDPTVWAVRVFDGQYVFRTRHLSGAIIDVELWDRTLQWSPLGTVDLSNWDGQLDPQADFRSVVRSVKVPDAVAPAELVGVDYDVVVP
jgi:hypothetical protein